MIALFFCFIFSFWSSKCSAKKKKKKQANSPIY